MLTHLVPVACSAIKERAYKLARQTSINVSRPFLLSTHSLLGFKQIFLRRFYINHLDVYQQRMCCLCSSCLAERSRTGLRHWLMLTLILRRSHTGTVWFYTSTSNKRAARPKLYTKSLTRDLKLMYSRFTLVRISINL